MKYKNYYFYKFSEKKFRVNILRINKELKFLVKILEYYKKYSNNKIFGIFLIRVKISGKNFRRKFKNFALTVCLSIAAVEAVQLFTMLGRFDIDDLIFNLAGATIGFGIWKMKPVINLLRKYKLL